MRVSRTTPWLLVATLTAAGAAAAAGYGLTAPKQYRATAELLVAPVSSADTTFAGLDVLRDASGRPRAAATAAVLVRSPQVAATVRTQLGVRRSASSLLGEVEAHPAGTSNVVDVTAQDASATTAAQLANGFVDALIAQRTTSFQSQLASVIRRDTELLAARPAGPQAAELSRRLAVLRGFQGQPDPSLRRATTAVAPSAASWPVLWSLILIGAGIGLALGLLAWAALRLARRPGAVAPAEYSRGMSDRAVNALVERLEQRLAARESALAVRERELQAKIDELRALERRQALPPRTDASPDLELREAELAERERTLAERVAAVTKRELAVARAAAQHQPHSQPPPQAPAAARAEPVQAPARPAGGGFNLDAIARLVGERGDAFPDRRDEWESTVFFLRGYAGADGTLPDSFDGLVEDTFAPLLA